MLMGKLDIWDLLFNWIEYVKNIKCEDYREHIWKICWTQSPASSGHKQMLTKVWKQADIILNFETLPNNLYLETS